MPDSKNMIDVGEFEVPRTFEDMMSGLVQSLNEKLGEFLHETPQHSKEQILDRYQELTDLYLWDLLRQISDLNEARNLLRESFELLLFLSRTPLLSDALGTEVPKRKETPPWPLSSQVQ